MLFEPKYQAAIEVAHVIEEHFTHHLDMAKKLGAIDLAPIPDAKIIESIINISFWASLRREEGFSPKVSLALFPPELAEGALHYEQPIPLTSDTLTKLAPGVSGSGIHLGIWQNDGSLYIWGTTTSIPPVSFVLQVVEPALLVIKHRRIKGFGKFVNIAVLKGDQIKIVDEHSSSLADCPALLTSLLDMPLPSFINNSVNILIEIAVSMRAHGRGGLLAVVPGNSKNWQESIIHPISYPVKPSYAGLRGLTETIADKGEHLWQQELRRQVEFVGGVTAIDGATIIDQNHELLAFGAKITRSTEGLHIDKMIITEPLFGVKAQTLHPAKYGGTRHLAAAQFVFDQRDAITMVASVDGKFTVMAWSAGLNMVHAHRIDVLLL